MVSDTLLRRYLPQDFPACKQAFLAGADLGLFTQMPFSVATKGYNSRSLIDNFLQASNLSLNIVYEANQPDLLHLMTAHDYAASFSLSMYLPNIRTLNRTLPSDNQLNIFPIAGLTQKNPIFLVSRKGAYFPKYTQELVQLIKDECRSYADPLL